MELFKGGQRLGKWTVGIGKQSAPTPSGHTFLLGSISDTAQRYSPVILPLGAHLTFGCASYLWVRIAPLWTASVAAGEPPQYIPDPQPMSFGTRSSDGCIRVPRDALHQLTQVPLGMLVLIDEN
jgi:hypothetical protein